VAAFLQGNPLILEMDDEHVKLKSLVNGIPAKM
jgi:hypothetical protein